MNRDMHARGDAFDVLLRTASDALARLEELRHPRRLICLVCFNLPLQGVTAYAFSRVLRTIDRGVPLDLLLESTGGDVDVAAKIAKLCKARNRNLNVIVPFHAKSAASLIALHADCIVMPPSGELGPVDPQVRHKKGDVDTWIPANSIAEAIKFITEEGRTPT